MDDRSSSSWPLFRQSAEDLATKLHELKTAEAMGLGKEATAMAATFASWEINRPTSEVRVATIHALFDLNRRAQDYLSKMGRPPTSKNGPPSSTPKPTPRR